MRMFKAIGDTKIHVLRRSRSKTPSSQEDVALVPCQPYTVIGHVKVKRKTFFTLKDDPDQEWCLIETQTPLQEVIDTLPVSEKIQRALMHSDASCVYTDDRGKHYLKFRAAVKLRPGHHVFLTVCSFETDDIAHPDAEFLTWTGEEELTVYDGGKQAAVGYLLSQGLDGTAHLKRLVDALPSSGLQRILAIDTQRRRAALKLLNDTKTFVPYTGHAYVLGKGPMRKVSNANRDRAVRRAHQQLKEARDFQRKKYMKYKNA